MAIVRNKRKLEAIKRDNHEDHHRVNYARNTNSPRIQENSITQVSEEIEVRVTKKLSQEFSKTESRILDALSRLDEFLLNPQARAHSGPVPETSQNLSRGNQGTNEDRSQNDSHTEVEVSMNQCSQNLGSEETSYTHTFKSTDQIRCELLS